MPDVVIAPDLWKRYDDLIHRRNQCLMRGNLMQRAEYWMDYEDREVAFIERVSKAEQENVALRAERRTILDSVTRHCTPEQINAITADTLAARGREGESEVQP